jgi:hypothetical protein
MSCVQIKTRFRRASQLRIGPLLLSDPVMMEMRASRLVAGFHDRVVGIAGESTGLFLAVPLGLLLCFVLDGRLAVGLEVAGGRVAGVLLRDLEACCGRVC